MQKLSLRFIERILLFSFTLTLIIGSSSAWALENYYGSDLSDNPPADPPNAPYDDPHSLRNQLFKILSQIHVLQKDGSPDKIQTTCPSQSQCVFHNPIGYDAARRQLFGHLFLLEDRGTYAIPDLYCDKVLTVQDFPRNQGPGPNKIPSVTVANAEHSWPQSHFSRNFSNTLQKSDLHILFPVSSQANSLRNNYAYGEVSSIRGQFCASSELGWSNRDTRTLVFMPPANMRGNVARAKFYFAVRYKMPIGPDEEETLKQWNRQDPVDEDERYRTNLIYEIQGDRNPFVDHPEWVDLIADY